MGNIKAGRSGFSRHMMFLILLICGGSVTAETFEDNIKFICETAQFIGRVWIQHDALKVDGKSKYYIYQVKVESWDEVYKRINVDTHDILYALFETERDLRGEHLRGDHLVIGGIIDLKEVEGKMVQCVIVKYMWLEMARSQVVVIEGDGHPSYKTYTGFFKHLCDLRSVLNTQGCPYSQ